MYPTTAAPLAMITKRHVPTSTSTKESTCSPCAGSTATSAVMLADALSEGSRSIATTSNKTNERWWH